MIERSNDVLTSIKEGKMKYKLREMEHRLRGNGTQA
jgi:hypothetical protein